MLNVIMQSVVEPLLCNVELSKYQSVEIHWKAR